MRTKNNSKNNTLQNSSPGNTGAYKGLAKKQRYQRNAIDSSRIPARETNVPHDKFNGSPRAYAIYPEFDEKEKWAQDTGLLENGTVMVTSDHGQLLGEYGLYGHGQYLYDELIRVPLYIRVPKEPQDIENNRSLNRVGYNL